MKGKPFLMRADGKRDLLQPPRSAPNTTRITHKCQLICTGTTDIRLEVFKINASADITGLIVKKPIRQRSHSLLSYLISIRKSPGS